MATELSEVSRCFFSLHELSQAVAAARRPQAIYEASLDCLRDCLGVETSSVLIRDRDGVMRFKAWRGLSDTYRAAVDGHSPWGPDADDPQPVLIEDVDVDERLGDLRPVVRAEGIAALAFVPLCVEGRLLGKFMLYYGEPHRFTNDELLIARTIASQVAFAVQQQEGREHRDHIEAVFRSTETAIAQIDLSARFILVNDRFCELVGLPRETLLSGMTTYDVTFPEDRPATRRGLDALLRGEPSFTFEKRYVRPDGSIVWVLKSVSAVHGPDGEVTGAITLVNDITQRKQADEELRQSEQRYRELVEALGLAVYTTDAEGRIQLFNDAAEQLWGRRPEVGVDLWCGSWRVFYPDGRPMSLGECPMAIALHENREVRGVEIVIERPDGSRADVLPYPTPMRDAAGRVIGAVNVLVDITERKLVERRLEERNRLIQAIAANISVGLFFLDSEARIQFMNPAAEVITGTAFADVRGAFFHDSFHRLTPDGRPFASDACPINEACLALTSLRGHEDRFVRPDGSFYDVMVNVAPLEQESLGRGSIVDLQDITARKQAVDALRESEERFRFMADSAPALIWMADARQRCTYVNRGWTEFTGIDVEDDPSRCRDGAIHPDDRTAWAEAIAAAYRERKPFSVEYRVRRDDGEYRWLLDAGTPLLAPDGSLEGFIGAGVDVTERHEAEDMMVEAATLKDQFLGLVSHELRTPIATIFGNGLLLLRRGDLLTDEDRRQSLEDIVAESAKLQEIIENLLLLTRLEHGQIELQPVLLHRVAEEEVNDFQRRHPARKLILTRSQELPMALGQDTLVALVLRNLLSNAEKYSAPDAPIEVTVGTDDQGRPQLRVRDHGIGIEEAELEHVFRPFFRSRRATSQAKGMGLGLAVCKRVIEAQGGAISVRSSVGAGSEFAFRLPVATIPPD